MTRERVLAAVVALTVLGVLGALLERSIHTVEREEALRREMLANRVFDELERELVTLVDREEARPFLHYSYAYVPDNDAGPAGISRSPLATLPTEPEVVGYFQIAPDGELSTPYRPARGNTTNPVDVVEGLEDRLADATADLVSLARQAPVQQAVRPTTKQTKRPRDEVAMAKGANDALNRNLNAERSRVPQTQKVQLLQAGNFVSNSAPEDFLQVQATVQQQLDPDPERQQDLDAPVPDSLRELPATSELEVLIEPFTATVRGTDLVLYRTVQLGGDRWVQGLVLERPVLLARLQEAVLVGDLAQVARITWDGTGPFTHTFQAPFETLSVGLDLAGLPPRQSTSYFWMLAGLLLAVVAVAGLLASRWLAETARLARQRGDFVAAVSHELRSPLTSIRMYSEMLEQGMVPGEPQRREYYRTIRLESERLGRLVEDVLAFSRLERGQERPGTAGSVGEVLEEVGRLFRPLTDRDGVELRVAVAPEVTGARIADRDALVQVLTNLVDNALKFSKDREVRRVAVSAERGDAGVELAVRDTGPGVDPSFLPRIFEAFTRGEAELTRKTKGTGIGLALVRGLVEDLGGRVRARNLADGFEVVVLLPEVGPLPAPAHPT
ncbi:MAG: HAMP domain-containing sensor histidine kinase [Myxococcota bacterium]